MSRRIVAPLLAFAMLLSAAAEAGDSRRARSPVSERQLRQVVQRILERTLAPSARRPGEGAFTFETTAAGWIKVKVNLKDDRPLNWRERGRIGARLGFDTTGDHPAVRLISLKDAGPLRLGPTVRDTRFVEFKGRAQDRLALPEFRRFFGEVVAPGVHVVRAEPDRHEAGTEVYVHRVELSDGRTFEASGFWEPIDGKPYFDAFDWGFAMLYAEQVP
jgi:hypothetical protein